MKLLMNDEAHADAVFLVHSSKSNYSVTGGSTNRIKEEEDEEDDVGMLDVDEGKISDKTNMIPIRAHRSVLTARADYFKKLFRSITTRNSKNGKPKSNKEKCNGELDEYTIQVDPIFSELHIRYVLEFMYTNRLADVQNIDMEDMLSILHLSDQWNLRDLKRLVEHALLRDHMRVETVARLYGATERFSARRLCKACTEFIMANLRQLAGNAVFEEEMKNYPHLCSAFSF